MEELVEVIVTGACAFVLSKKSKPVMGGGYLLVPLAVFEQYEGKRLRALEDVPVEDWPREAFESRTVEQLKELLEDRGLSTDGLKVELVTRLAQIDAEDAD